MEKANDSSTICIVIISTIEFEMGQIHKDGKLIPNFSTMGKCLQSQ